MKYSLTCLLLGLIMAGQAQIIDSFPIPPMHFDEKGDLVIAASATSSEHDFDFFIGKWNMKNKYLKSRLTNSKEYIEFEAKSECNKILEGNGDADVVRRIVDGKPFEGRTVRIFDRKTRLWRLYWIDTNRDAFDPPQIGSFDGNIGLFFAKDMWKGQPVIVVYRWDRTNPEQPLWSQAFSPDNGKTWEWNYTNTSYRLN